MHGSNDILGRRKSRGKSGRFDHRACRSCFGDRSHTIVTSMCSNGISLPDLYTIDSLAIIAVWTDNASRRQIQIVSI